MKFGGIMHSGSGQLLAFKNFRKIQDGRRHLGDSFVTLSNGKAIFSYSLNRIFLKLGTHVHWMRGTVPLWRIFEFSPRMPSGGVLVQNPFWVVTENRVTELHEILWDYAQW